MVQYQYRVFDVARQRWYRSPLCSEAEAMTRYAGTEYQRLDHTRIERKIVI